MIFSQVKILDYLKRGLIKIEPFSESNIGVASYDIHLDLPTPITLHKGDFINVKTKEKLTLSPTVACFISTRGSMASKGLDASQSSFFCEPDTNNQITLEISYNGPESLVLKSGDSIAKAVFMAVE